MATISVSDALARRFSCRAFQDKSVPQAVLTRVLEKASLSPSGTNLQPWKIHVITGEKKSELEHAVKDKFPSAVMGEGFDFRIYPEKMSETLRQRRTECGENLYQALGIAREDKPGRINQTMKNADFFGAPVGMIITLDPCVADAQLVDCGIFLQSMMLLLEEEGLASCAQGFWGLWPDTIRNCLGLDNELILVGLAIGYEDRDHIVNRVRQSRLSLDEFVRFHQ